ncbi:N-acetyl sugar amidotransferase [Magnetovibrio sp.]|uniref:N-acetyl sugar amidotransferase n=1 Tax=Magnetovibrio sp. TaxID=2024836 RepID=UPI002F944680
MRTCTKCVMPETAETLEYDDSGQCSVCSQIEYKNTKVDWDAKGRELDEIIESVRGKYDYDCIVPFSGGKDSTFQLWYLVRVKKLKPLVVRFDHSFMRPKLIENNLRTLRTLGVDCQTFTPNWQVVRKLMYESLKRRGDFCWHCHTGIFAYPMWVSVWQNIPLVIWGEPSSEYTSFYEYGEDEEVDERRFNTLVNLGINAEDMLGMLNDKVSDYPITERDLKPYTFPPAREIRSRNIRSICLGSYIPWDVKKQVKIIEDELGWEGDEVEGVPPGYEYEKIECYMQGLRDYTKHLKRGFGRTAHLTSIDIRNGRMTRDEAVELTEKYDGKRPFALDLFLHYLGITEEEYFELVRPHLVPPHEFPDEETRQRNRAEKPPSDFDKWTRITGDRKKDGKSKP